jgi:transposase
MKLILKYLRNVQLALQTCHNSKQKNFRSERCGSKYLLVFGLWVMRSNSLYNAETVAHVYKALWTVEDIFRTTKSIMETRPIYHRCNETIRGHVFCSFLALLLKTELERRMKFANLQCEWARVIRGLEALQQVEATFQDKRFVLRSQLTSEASAALRATGVAAPPTLREVS